MLKISTLTESHINELFCSLLLAERWVAMLEDLRGNECRLDVYWLKMCPHPGGWIPLPPPLLSPLYICCTSSKISVSISLLAVNTPPPPN